MNLKKTLLLPIGLILSISGCISKPFLTYNMATTSFQYDPTYRSYMLELNNVEIGGGFGKGITTDQIKVGPQIITWKDTNSGEIHTSKNDVIISRSQLMGTRYLAVHIYPDDIVEIITSDTWPQPTEKGLFWMKKLREKNKK